MPLVLLPSVKVKAQLVNNIVINSDGSIDPASAPIQTNGNVYALTDSIVGNDTNTILVQKSDIILDGGGFSLEGQGAEGSVGIDVSGVHNVTVQDFTITNFVWLFNLKTLLTLELFKTA
jgi:hypothetical protein